MSILDVIKARSSYRSTFVDDSMTRADLRLNLEASLVALSGCNKQTTYLIAVDDRQFLDRLNAVIDPPLWVTKVAGSKAVSRPRIRSVVKWPIYCTYRPSLSWFVSYSLERPSKRREWRKKLHSKNEPGLMVL